MKKAIWKIPKITGTTTKGIFQFDSAARGLWPSSMLCFEFHLAVSHISAASQRGENDQQRRRGDDEKKFRIVEFFRLCWMIFALHSIEIFSDECADLWLLPLTVSWNIESKRLSSYHQIHSHIKLIQKIFSIRFTFSEKIQKFAFSRLFFFFSGEY